MQRFARAPQPGNINMRPLLCFALLLLAGRSSAQIGISICACQPTYYEFTLDFALSGESCNVAGTEGVNEAVCVLNTLGDENVTDLVPVIVNSITILEVDQTKTEVVGQEVLRNLSLSSGGTFSYTSVLTFPQNLTEETLPSGIQLFIRGLNAENQQLTNLLAVEYDNSCSVVANVSAGQQLGWAVFTELGPPNNAVCPLVTASPSIASPTSTPASSPSELPVASPTESPSNAPTSAPMAPSPTIATEAPTAATESPVEVTTSPSSAPTIATEAPTAVTESPVEVTTSPSSAPMTKAPETARPNPSPIAPPTSEPSTGAKPSCKPFGKGGKGSFSLPTSKVTYSMKMIHPSKSKKGSKISSKVSPSRRMQKLEARFRRFLMVGATPSASPSVSPTACPDDEEGEGRSRVRLLQRESSDAISPPQLPIARAHLDSHRGDRAHRGRDVSKVRLGESVTPR